MYQESVTTQAKAICHLFLHCCYKDGNFSEEEVDNVAGKLTALELHRELNMKDELHAYRSYAGSIVNERGYVDYLLKLIAPVNELALFSYCMELGVSDSKLDTSEIRLFDLIGDILQIGPDQRLLVQKLISQRQLVTMQKYF